MCNSDIFNLHLVQINLPVETANEVADIITVATYLTQRKTNNFHKMFCNY